MYSLRSVRIEYILAYSVGINKLIAQYDIKFPTISTV